MTGIPMAGTQDPLAGNGHLSGHPLEKLALADPDLVVELDDICPGIEACHSEFLAFLVRDALWGLSQEQAFGRTLARGYARLLQVRAKDLLADYSQAVRRAGARGATLGRVAADHWVPVLLVRDPCLSRQFRRVLDTLQRQGTHTLEAPLKALPLLCRRPPDALAYLELVQTTFKAQLPYERCLHWIHRLPREVRTFPAGRRAFLCAQTEALMAQDPALAAGFLEGLEKGTLLLADGDLAGFVAQGLAISPDNPAGMRHFLSLESAQGRAALARRQTTASLAQVQPALGRYLRARLDRPVPLNSLASLPRGVCRDVPEPWWVCCDGQTLYLAPELGVFADARQNRDLYKLLVKLEAGLLEWGTFDFDFETAAALVGWEADDGECPPSVKRGVCDLERFLGYFDTLGLALDLFTLFEHGRIRQRLFSRYPGMKRMLRTVLNSGRLPPELLPPDSVLGDLYWRIVYPGFVSGRKTLPGNLQELVRDFEHLLNARPAVEAVAPFVLRAYRLLATRSPQTLYGAAAASGEGSALAVLGRRIIPGLYTRALGASEAEVRRMQAIFRAHGRNVATKALRRKLKARGCWHAEDLMTLWAAARSWKCSPSQSGAEPDWRTLDLEGVCGIQTSARTGKGGGADALFAYPEWDNRLHDYLHNHVRVHAKQGAKGNGTFYGDTLERHRGLILGLRRAFEMLKPQGLGLLRQWPEGDEFDYRALIDFALDRRAGRSPSERLYIKRVKAQRDVAVLVLVDASRSTAHAAGQGDASVLEVEKEALVLLGEALQVLGDRFAMAAFSGTGRLGVDFWWLKDFEEPFNPAVHERIAGLQPQRSTRMGAAIRHATHCLAQVAAKVRLLAVIGDGFPNDLEYKQEYAIADTRRAIAEARNRHIHTHAVTVNNSGDPQLDALYGETHHNTISDVRELPDKLLRIYSALTR